MVVDETGEKMSKVKGNVMDPLDLVYGTSFAAMVEKTAPLSPPAEALAKFRKAYPSAAAMGAGFPAFGADAVRFTLVTYPPSNKRIALSPKRIEGNRHFLNKIWNATRLALELLGSGFTWPEQAETARHFYNRWIRSRFAAACESVHTGFDEFRIDEAALASYHFFWDELCSWYLEIVKPILRRTPLESPPSSHDLVRETRFTLAYVVEGSLRLMHPFMPFITEELWQRLPRPRSRRISLAFGPYPTRDDEGPARCADVDDWMDIFKDVVSAARAIRSEHGVDKKADVRLTLRSARPETLDFLSAHAESIRTLVKTQGLPILEGPGGRREAGTTMGVVPASGGPIEVLVALRGLVDRDGELARIEREVKKVDRELSSLDKKLAAPGFTERAPKEVVEEATTQRRALVEAKARLDTARKLAEEL